MATKPLRPCSYVGCHSLTRERYCEQHKFKTGQQSQDQHRYYDRYKRDKRSTAFYKSNDWEQARRQALMRDHGLCQHCLKEKRMVMADMVHHKVEVRDDWEKRFDIENLISLCNPCHNKIHKKAPGY